MDKRKLAERLIQQSKSNDARKTDKSISKITNEMICEEFGIGGDKLNSLKNHDEETKKLIQELSQSQLPVEDFKDLKDRTFRAAKKLLEQIENNPVDSHKQFESVVKYINEEEKRRGPETSQEQDDVNQVLLEHGVTPEVVSGILADPKFAVFCVAHKELLETKAKELGWNSELDNLSGLKK